MEANNLVKNGSFTTRLEHWLLQGTVANAQLVDEANHRFLHLDQNVAITQYIAVTAGAQYSLRFRLRALDRGNGIGVTVESINAQNEASTLVVQTFGETLGWIELNLPFNTIEFTMIRLRFEAHSGADIDGVTLVTAQSTLQNGLTGNYYNGRNFDLLVFQRIDRTIDFNWMPSKPPAFGLLILDNTNYSMRWHGFFRQPESLGKRIIFRVKVADGVRLWVYGLNAVRDQPIIDNWVFNSIHYDHSEPIALEPGQLHHIELQFFSSNAPAIIQLLYYFEGDNPTLAKVIPETNFFQFPHAHSEIAAMNNSDENDFLP